MSGGWPSLGVLAVTTLVDDVALRWSFGWYARLAAQGTA